MRVLVVDDDDLSAMILERALSQGHHEVVVAGDALLALKEIEQSKVPFDAVMTDLLMPCMDGIELIERLRATLKQPPLMIVTTVVTTEESRRRALAAGADEYVTKPYQPVNLLAVLEACRLRREAGSVPVLANDIGNMPHSDVRPPMVGVALTAGTGGPNAVAKVLEGLQTPTGAAFFVVQQLPAFILDTMSDVLQSKTSLRVIQAEHGTPIAADHVYLAPADRHMRIDPARHVIELVDTPPENFVRPSADILFPSLAATYGRFSIATVLTGMGRDGCRGAATVASAGGVVLAQSPETALNPNMPKAVINMKIASVVPLGELASAIDKHIRALGLVLSA